MSEGKFDPVQEFINLRDTVSKAIGQGIQGVSGAMYPILIDIYEINESVQIITSPLDNVVKESIEVSMEGDVLTIKGETQEDDAEDGLAYLHRERRFGVFSRSVRIPRAVNAGDAQARFKDGKLIISLPKTKDSRPQVIDVEPTE